MIGHDSCVVVEWWWCPRFVPVGRAGALYDVYGFRPDVIAGTSVGSVNGVKLALAKRPAANDPAAILAAVAAGRADSGLTALRALEAEWDTFSDTSKFFLVQLAFKGSLIEDLVNAMNAAPTGQPPMSATLGPEIDSPARPRLTMVNRIPELARQCRYGDQDQRVQRRRAGSAHRRRAP